MSLQQQLNIKSAIKVANELFNKKHYHECLDICIRVLGEDYARADVWSLAGSVMLEMNMCDRALEYFAQSVEYAPNEPIYKINLAEAHRRSGNPALCIDMLESLLKEDKTLEDSSTLHFNLAKAYSDMQDSESSIKHYTIAIKLDPNDLGAMFNLANAKVSLKHFGEAIELYQYALDKGYLDAGVNLAYTYVQLGQFSEALNVYSAIYNHYKGDSDFLFNYANALNYANANTQHIQTLYQQAISLNKDKVEYCINYAHFLLKNGALKQGFMLYEERKKLPNMLPAELKNIWHYSGKRQNLAKQSVLVYGEQGLGDFIMFARFLPLLKERVKSLCVIAKPSLLPLVNKLGIRAVSDISEVGQYDRAISLLSLPLLLNIKDFRELDITPFALDSIESSESFKLKRIGICFSTDSNFPESANKNIPLDVLASALSDIKAKGVEIYSLNKAACDEAILRVFDIKQVALTDFGETYNAIANMDMVISIDSAVAHLSASMGVPSIVLLNKRYDWRWGNGKVSPWYRSAVCMTQSEMGSWDSVMAQLRAYLDAL